MHGKNIFSSLEYQAVIQGDPTVEITIDWEADGTSNVLSAADVWRLIFDSGKPWMLSANGTILSYEKKGIVPGLLERWYAERKVLQAKKKAISELENGIEISDDLVAEIRKYLS